MTRAEAFKQVQGGRAVWRQARKPHRCDATDQVYAALRCRRLINKADWYFDTGVLVGDSFRTRRYCKECADMELR